VCEELEKAITGKSRRATSPCQAEDEISAVVAGKYASGCGYARTMWISLLAEAIIPVERWAYRGEVDCQSAVERNWPQMNTDKTQRRTKILICVIRVICGQMVLRSTQG